MNNLSSYCWLDDAKIRASDKDLSVQSKKKMPNVSSRGFVIPANSFEVIRDFKAHLVIIQNTLTIY